MSGRNLSPRLGILLSAVLLGAALTPSAVDASSNAKSKDEGEKARLMALVKVEIKLENGKIVRHAGELVEWDEDATVVFDGGGHSHALSLHLHPKDDKAKKISVKMAYDRDSSPVLAPFTFDTRARKREIIQSDGGLALAITITPKKAKPQENKRRDDSIDGPSDPNDPLDGLE